MAGDGAETCTELAGMAVPAVVGSDDEEALDAEREFVCCAEGAAVIVIALSGFSKCSESGPSPSRIRARESGMLLLCQPWSAW